MRKIATLTLVIAIAFAAPVFANDEVQEEKQDVQSDVGAIQKDNTALAHDRDNLSSNRAAKAADKANGNYGKQAVDSVKIGANKTAIHEKKAERHIDKKILRHHSRKLHKHENDANTPSN